MRRQRANTVRRIPHILSLDTFGSVAETLAERLLEMSFVESVNF